MSAALLDDALARAEGALAAGDVPVAAAATAEALAICGDLERRGVRLEDAALRALAERHARCARAAATRRDALAAELEVAGRSRQATSAYRRNGP